ncbi:unnamed protein product [Camellia sinensis]
MAAVVSGAVSKSCRDGRIQTESSFNGGRPTRPGHPTSMHDLRSYSTSYATSSFEQAQPTQMGKELKIKKIKKSTSVGSSKSWSLNDPELQRKKRFASYECKEGSESGCDMKASSPETSEQYGLALLPNFSRTAPAGTVVSLEWLCGCSSGRNVATVDGKELEAMCRKFQRAAKAKLPAGCPPVEWHGASSPAGVSLSDQIAPGHHAYGVG